MKGTGILFSIIEKIKDMYHDYQRFKIIFEFSGTKASFAFFLLLLR